MELTNDFRLDLPVQDAWAVLTDLERIAPCMPGAQLQEVEGDTYRGIVKVKVGPVTAQYKGEAGFLERDEDAHVAVLRAEGRETRGQGNANATITARLTPDGDGTAVALTTDLTITGKVAQFGRGVLADVSATLVGQFVDNLESSVLADSAAAGPAGASGAATQPADESGEPGGDAAPAEAGTAGGAGTATEVASPPAVRRIDSPEPTPVDLVGTAGSPVAKRVVPVLLALLVVWLLGRRLCRHRGADQA